MSNAQCRQEDHWTALVYFLEQGASHFQATHFDSLTEVHEGCRRQAADIFACLSVLGVSAQPELPPTQLPVNQGDGWSCGWQTVSRFEEAYRQFRGEGMKRSYTSKEDRRQASNKLALSVKEACQEKGAEAPPPLPPPPAKSVSPPPQPLPAPGAPLAGSSAGIFGCARCRYSEAGCLDCNPIKAMRFAAK